MCYNWINAGDVTDDKKLKAKGILDKTVGKVKEAAEDVKDTAEGVAKDIKEKFDK